jgi:membrane-associated protein
MSTLLSPNHLIETFGTIGLIAVVFAESGLLIGFFLPGDSLLFTAGLLASQGKLNFAVILVGCCIAAAAGGQVGYVIGARVGPALFRRPDSRLFKKEYVEQAEGYFERYGSRTIVLARFVPIVRTFAPVMAGVSKMHWRTFATYNLIGSVVWGAGVLIAGHILGDTVPNIDKYLLPIIVLIVAVSTIPVGLEVLRARRAQRGG